MSYKIQIISKGIGGYLSYSNETIKVDVPIEISDDYRRGYEVSFKDLNTYLTIEKHEKLINEIKKNVRQWSKEHDQTFSW
jgi:hypothetical protein